MKREPHPFRGPIATIAAIGLIFVIGGLLRLEPVGRALALGHSPRGLFMMVTGAWALVTALTTIPKPHNGLVLVAGTLLTLPLTYYLIEQAAATHSYEPLSQVILVFTAAGGLLMLMAKISTETKDRRPWLHEAWPGMVLVAVSLVVTVVIATRTVPRIHYVPPMMLPAERGP